ncbi:MAG: DUF4282 domain-containing protein [Bacillota bacterium]
MSDFLSFRKMITPVFIQIIFWISVMICVISGLVMIVTGAGARYGGGGQVLSGLITIFIGPLFVRVYCEILILFFRMNETLTDIKNEIMKRHPSA